MPNLPSRKDVASFMLIAAIAVSGFAPASAAHAQTVKTSSGKTCTIVGTSGADILTGTAKNDVICGLGGDDLINGGGGNDTIDGGKGNDIISGGAGNDDVHGDKGNDRIIGDAGNDKLYGDSGDDGLVGGTGADTLAGSDGTPAPEEKNLCERDLLDTVTYCGFDESGPVLDTISLDKTLIDTTTSAQTITATMHVTDDLMGVAALSCYVYSPKDNRRISGKGDGRAKKISGTINDGIWSCSVTLRAGTAPGDYRLLVPRTDNAGNSTREFTLDSPVITQAGAASGDQQSPRISRVKLDKTSVDTSAKAARISLTIDATDDFSGVSGVFCGVRHMNYYGAGGDWQPANKVSGTKLASTWKCEINLPKGVGQGKWGLTAYATDNSLKSYYMYSDLDKPKYWNTDKSETDLGPRTVILPDDNYFMQTGAGDDVLPVMNSISLDRDKVNTSSSSQTYTATVTLFDQSGISVIGLWTDSPSTGAFNEATCSRISANGKGLEVWKCKGTLRLGSQRGLHLFEGEIYDKTGNREEFRTDSISGKWIFYGFGDQQQANEKLVDLGSIGILNTEE